MNEETLLKLFSTAFETNLPKILNALELRELQRLYPKQVKGNAKAAELLGITPNALRLRVHKGNYLEGIHFKKISDRISVWDRDILLRERFKNEAI